uniref:TEP1-F n=1 Tax=Scolopendra japonica TaxID=2609777 RepID=A0A0E4B800_9MYRI|nr:complement component 3-2 [Scolopendra japonica]
MKVPSDNLLSIFFIALIETYAVEYVSCINIVVSAPNVIRFGVEETVAVSILNHPSQVQVDVCLHDHPLKISTISCQRISLYEGKPKIVNVVLHPENIPEQQRSDANFFVLLVVRAVSGEFTQKQAVIPVMKYSGYVFVQTDKPLYLPNQKVHIRVLRLDEKLLPKNDVVRLEIKNPKDMIVRQQELMPNTKGIREAVFTISQVPILGNWSVSVHYGFKFVAKTTVRFEIKEYVLPTYSVTIDLPKVILETQKDLEGKVIAKYVYGKPVQGFVNFKYSIKNSVGVQILIGMRRNVKLSSGEIQFKIPLEKEIKAKNLPWFPNIEKSRLIMEAEAIEQASGKRETTIVDNTVFTTSPYKISFKNSLKSFKPGFPYQVQVEVLLFDNQQIPKPVTVEISATAFKKDYSSRQIGKIAPEVTDEFGRAVFQFDTDGTDTRIVITAKTNDKNYEEKNQANQTFTGYQFSSPSNSFIWLQSPKEGLRFKVGKTLHTTATLRSSDASQRLYYMVVNRGNILAMNQTEAQSAVIRTLHVPITTEMVPSFRLVVFVIEKYYLVADSMQFEVERICKYNEGKGLIIEASTPLASPGENINFKIKGEEESYVGLLGVDEAVYVLNKQDLLTKEKMFRELRNHDLGKGPGGGISTEAVLRDSGIIILSSVYIGEHGREESLIQSQSRKKRSLPDKVNEYSGKAAICCRMGQFEGPQHLNCTSRATMIEDSIGEKHNCSVAFLDCCQHAEEIRKTFGSGVGRSLDEEDESDPNFADIMQVIETFEQETLDNIRRYFPETWILDIFQITNSECKREDLSVCEKTYTAPHSITTWMVQGFGLSRTTGLCIADPIRIPVFKPMFVELNLPPAAVLGEQIEVVATVFNYGQESLKVTVYMYGVEGICMGAAAGEKSPVRQVEVSANSATSVSFPVMPLEVSEYPLRVVALSWRANDAIEKKLRIVPEGVTKDKSLSFFLDPSGLIRNKHRKREVTPAGVIEYSTNKQKMKINLTLPENYVPGTEECFVSVIGDSMGSVVSTSLKGLDQFLVAAGPHACGEQTLVKLAPLVYTINYLKKTKQLTSSFESKGYSYISQSYDQQMKYRKADGSFSLWTFTESGTWLTAYVLKVFCQAYSSNIFSIPNYIRCDGIKWLLTKQYTNGEFFPLSYRIYGDQKIGLTAFVLITMLECDSCYSAEKNLAVSRATAYLRSRLDSITNYYTMAIVAYALALNNDDKANEANEKLKNMSYYSEENNIRYWSWKKLHDSDLYRPWLYRSKPWSGDIEATAYALLTQLQLNNINYSHPIVNWLNQHRSYYGFLSSTQDSVVTLQALTQYSVKARNPKMDMHCNIASTASSTARGAFHLTSNNPLELYDLKISPQADLFVEAEGTGLASMSLLMRYNVAQEPEKTCKFHLNITVEEYDDIIRPVAPTGELEGIDIIPENVTRSLFTQNELRDRFGIRDENEAAEDSDEENNGEKVHVVELNICMRYLEKEGNSGMSILDVGLFTGYSMKMEELKNLIRSIETSLTQFEQNERSTVLYFDEVPNKERMCISLRTYQDFHVGKVQPASVKIYSYYEPSKSCTKFYAPRDRSPMLTKICEGKQCFCAEGKCPSSTPFKEIRAKISDTERRRALLDIACHKSQHFIWNVTLEKITYENSFKLFHVNVFHVMKAGIQSNKEVEGETVIFHGRNECRYPEMTEGNSYIVMGTDGYPVTTEDGEIKFKYMFDRHSRIYHSRSLRDIADTKGRNLQKTFNSLYNRFVIRKEGCDN